MFTLFVLAKTTAKFKVGLIYLIHDMFDGCTMLITEQTHTGEAYSAFYIRVASNAAYNHSRFANFQLISYTVEKQISTQSQYSKTWRLIVLSYVH